MEVLAVQIKQSIGGRTIQVYRSVYVPEKKRSKQLLLLTFPAYCDQIPENVLKKVKPDRKLTDNELKEVQAWLDKRKTDREESGLKYSVSDLPRAINLATEGLTKYGITNEQAQIVYNSIDRITKAIRKIGFTRPKSEPVKPEPAQKKKAVPKKKVKKAGKKKTIPKKKAVKKTVKKVIRKTTKKSTGKKLKNKRRKNAIKNK